MLWRNCLTLFSLSVSWVCGAILPSEFSDSKQSAVTVPALTDKPVWEEYGLEASERAVYGAVSITAYRFKDSTGAFGAGQWLKGEGRLGTASTQADNYLLVFEGSKPSPQQIQQLTAGLPNKRRTSLPSLQNYLPADRLVAGSERYIAGPASLEKFEPRLPASILAFEKGAEAEVARYRIGENEEQLLLVSYPTPQIAIERQKAYQGIVGAVRRSGPLLAAVPAPVSTSAAQTLVGEVSYSPTLMWNEKTPVDPRKVGDMLLAICLLAAGLMVGSVLVGVFLGGIRRALGRVGVGAGDESLTELNLGR